jgi:hypothetical protein
VGSPHPAAANGDRPIVNSGDFQLLEAFYGTYDVDQCVNRADLMEWDPLGR